MNEIPFMISGSTPTSSRFWKVSNDNAASRCFESLRGFEILRGPRGWPVPACELKKRRANHGP